MTERRFADRAQLEQFQLDALNQLLDAILPANRFYAAKWSQAKAPRQFTTLDEFFARAPFTLKSELIEDQLAHPPFGSNLTYPSAAYSRYNQTSASTGTPLRWLDTAESWQWMLDNWQEVYAAAGISNADRIFFAFSFGPFLGFWTAFEAATALDCLCIPGGGLSSAARLKMIADNHATVLCCTPTYALRLGEVAREENIALANSSIKTIIVAGEPGGMVSDTRQRIENDWPTARLIDHHGMTEVGPVSVQDSPDRLILRVFETAYLAEILEPGSTRAVAENEIGELVLTTLGRTAAPLLRYRTGDLVKRTQTPAPDGAYFALGLAGGILGRIDDMAIIRGVNVYPAAVEAVLRRFSDIAEFRVTVQNSAALAELKLEIEPTPGCADPATLVHQVEAGLRDVFNLRVPVSAVAEGTLPRFELKARRWVRI